MAARVVGTLDVDRMLDNITPTQFDEWVAYWQVEPEPSERLAEILKLGFTGICRAWEMKVEPEDFEPFPDEISAVSSLGEVNMTPDQGAMALSMRLRQARRIAT